MIAARGRGGIMSLVHNERTKLTATFFNGIGIALFAVGAIAPAVSVLNAPAVTVPPGTAVMAIICLIASAALHFLARKVLARLIS